MSAIKETVRGIIVKQYFAENPKGLGECFDFTLEFACGICKKEHKHKTFMKELNPFQVECLGCNTFNKFHLE